MTDQPNPAGFTHPLPGGGPLVVLLAQISPAAREILTSNLHLRVIAAGELLLDAGEAIDSVGQVLAGTLGLIRRTADGRAHMTDFLMASDLCGHPFADRATCRLEALTQTQLLCLPRTDITRVMLAEPEAEKIMAAQVLHDLDRTRQALELIGARRVTQRVAGFLILLRRRLGVTFEDGPITLPMSRVHLALFLGTRPETISRSLHELADLAVLRIEDPYRFHILSAEALAKAAGQPDRRG